MPVFLRIMTKEDVILLTAGALGVVGAVWWFNRIGAATVAKSVGAGAVDIVGGAITGAAEGAADTGVGEAINESMVNPLVRAVTGEPDATLGGKVWDWLHPEDADALKYGMGLDGKPLRRSVGATATW
jgi:hypothetical protein